jgi:DNA-binding MarR family transcriptional regulator
MTGILDRLEGRHLLARDPDQRDRRVTVVRATSAGVQLIARETVPVQALSRALRRLGTAERAEVERGLQLLLGALSTELARGEPAPAREGIKH